MAYLLELFSGCNYICMQGTMEKKIANIRYDSKEVERGDLFVCLVGNRRDGHDYLGEALTRGAAAVVVQKNVDAARDATVIRVRNTRAALARLAVNFYGNPAGSLRMIGITGTKGKTSTAYMVWHMLRMAGFRAGLIGTMGLQMEEELIPYHNTTPESLLIQNFLRKMADQGYDFCVMEVSSQGLKMHRVEGIRYDVGVFTNISPDHIGPGEHKNFEEYLACKAKLFEKCRICMINADDRAVKAAAAKAGCKIRSYGVKSPADYIASEIQYQTFEECLGMSYQLDGVCQAEVELGMPGLFSIYNSLAALAICHAMGIPPAVMGRLMRKIKVRGRIEEVAVPGNYRLMIDYAHNATSLKSLLKTLRHYHPKRLVTVFGCGGNRSVLRRIQMGEVAGTYSDYTIITSDNPRYERPEDIIENIEQGMKKTKGAYITIPDRRKAIAYAIHHARENDLIVLAGKGHEDYQEINGRFYPMDERKIIDEIIRQCHYRHIE